MLTKLKCPKCSAEAGFSLSDPVYQGPFRCWKCKELYTIRIEDGEVKSFEPLSAEDFEKLKASMARKPSY